MSNSRILETLRLSIHGEVFSQKEFRRYYSVDASSYQIIPKIIVVPKNEKDISNIIKIANKFKISVTVRGAGTGLVGGALNSGIIIDMKNFDSCRIDKNHVKVGGGTIKGNLDKVLEKKKMFFPPNPSIGVFCSIGGMLGNNSSGSRSLKYGSVIDNVSEITFIDGSGEKITLPKNKKIAKKILETIKRIDKRSFPKVTKNSSGYRIDKINSILDTHKIITGSEGTLGIILSAKLSIRKKPAKRVLFIIEYDSVKKASENCIEINNTDPSAIEFVDRTTLHEINYKFNRKTKCLLFVEYDDKNDKTYEKIVKTIFKGKVVQKLEKELDILRWWKYRDSALHYSLKLIKKQKIIPHIIEDAAVPLENLPKLFTMLNEMNKKYKTKTITYGHAGNGNIHVRLILERSKTSTIKNITTWYFDEIIKMGGTITAEHGDGLARSEFIKKQYGIKNYRIFKEIKNIFDPKNTLNPDKIITRKKMCLKNLENFEAD